MSTISLSEAVQMIMESSSESEMDEGPAFPLPTVEPSEPMGIISCGISHQTTTGKNVQNNQ